MEIMLVHQKLHLFYLNACVYKRVSATILSSVRCNALAVRLNEQTEISAWWKVFELLRGN